MTQEEKELLLKDLCARLPYGVKVNFHGKIEILGEAHIYSNVQTFVGESGILYDVEFVKPYLRPMDSMTEEEKKEVARIFGSEVDYTNIAYEINWEFPYDYLSYNLEWDDVISAVEFFNRKHLDYRGLIPKGLALEAPEDMYKI